MASVMNCPSTQSLLLRWILLVFDHIDGYDQLHKFYNVVFCFINSQRLVSVGHNSCVVMVAGGLNEMVLLWQELSDVLVL